MSMSLSYLYLLPSTLRTLELISHIWILPDAVNHGCALLEDLEMELWQGFM